MLESISKGLKFPVLDHGYVTVRNWMGDESEIVNAARISYGEGTKSLNNDIGLIRYLIKHYHNTPLEMCEIQFEMAMPIFVARQFVRHRTANINEYSARYSEMLNVFYVPEPETLAFQSTTNKQGRSEKPIEDPELVSGILDCINSNDEVTFEKYKYLIKNNLSRELSRMVLPLNIYTKWVWKCDVNNLMKFLKLRQDSHAQYEIRVYADAMAQALSLWMPNVYQAYIDYSKEAVTFSRMEMDMLLRANFEGKSVKDWLSSVIVTYGSKQAVAIEYSLSIRELNEFMVKFEKNS